MTLLCLSLESRGGDLDAICARREVRRVVIAGRCCGQGRGGIRAEMDNVDGGAGDCRTAGIGNESGNIAAFTLTESAQGYRKGKQITHTEHSTSRAGGVKSYHDGEAARKRGAPFGPRYAGAHRMIYEEYSPTVRLRDAVASYWRFALPAAEEPTPLLHTIPPDGAVNVCWRPDGGAVIVGPRLSALRVPVQPDAEYRGIRFLPGAAGPLLGVDVPGLRDRVEVLHGAPSRPAMQELDDIVRGWAERCGWSGGDATVAEVTERIVASDGTAPISELTRGLGLSYRQVLRRFYRAAGLTPKEFARLRRMRAACLEAIRKSDPGWASVSASAGFADQAHLVREFQDIYGWPPTLVHEYLRRIEHLTVVP